MLLQRRSDIRDNTDNHWNE